MIVYVSIGNSDDKLTQREWAALYADTNRAIRFQSIVVGTPTIHGQWVSPSMSPYQNACWCVELNDGLAERLRGALRLIAREHQQDSILWAEADAEFLTPMRPSTK